MMGFLAGPFIRRSSLAGSVRSKSQEISSISDFEFDQARAYSRLDGFMTMQNQQCLKTFINPLKCKLVGA